MFQVLADAKMTGAQLDAVIGSRLDFMELPTKDIDSNSESTDQQWELDSNRLELLVSCQFPTFQVDFKN